MSRRLVFSGLVAAVTSAATAADTGPGPGGIHLKPRGDGWILTTDKGMTLYTFDRDATPGKSACNGPCATNWPPLMAATARVCRAAWRGRGVAAMKDRRQEDR